MKNFKYKVLKQDKRINHVSKFTNYILDTCINLNWAYEIVVSNSNSLEIILEKSFERDTVTFRITILFFEGEIDINIDQTSFSCHGIPIFFKVLSSMFDNNLYRLISDNNKNVIDSEEILNSIFKNFHRSAQQLLKRHDHRETININDEYDVQDYLHSVLYLFFDDIRDEDTNPRNSGATSRGDFFLPKEGIMIETKISSDKNKDKEIGEQIIIDIKRYTANHDIKKIYFFVYNPYYKIKNPIGLEKDLSKDKNIEVVVKVFPK